jgi:hypothetical protein
LLKHSNIRRTLAAAAIGALLSGIFALSAPTTAWAETLPSGSGTTVSSSSDEVGLMGRPTGCRAQIPDSWGAVASCSSHHGGSYRAWVFCRHSDGRVSEYSGAWRQTGWSRAYCQGDSKAVSAGFETSVTDRT